MAKKDDFELNNLPIECRDESISKDDFKLVDSEKRVHEQKFETKPTTFFKDCVRRFKKNKSSVVAAYILGTLLVLSVLIPVVDRHDIKKTHSESIFLQPKLFNAGTGFWDGTKKWKNIPVDTGVNGFEETDKQEKWWPNPKQFKQKAVTKKTFSDIEYTDAISDYGKEGYVKFGYYSHTFKNKEKANYVEFKTRGLTTENLESTLDLSTGEVYLKTFDTYDVGKLKELEGDKEGVKFPDNYVGAPVSLWFTYDVVPELGKVETRAVKILEEKEVFSIGSKISSKAEPAVELASIIRDETASDPLVTGYKFENASFSVRMENQENARNTCVLIRSIEFEANLPEKYKKAVEVVNFNDATECAGRTIYYPANSATKNRKYWVNTSGSVKALYMSKIIYCTFVYDSYEAVYGDDIYYNFPISELEKYAKKDKKYIKWKVDSETDSITGKYKLTKNSEYEILDYDKSPIREFKNVTCDEDNGDIIVTALVSYYRFYGYKHMPRFLMGTDIQGFDMLKYVAEGLRSSLLLGIMTFVICFSFGLLWGSVSGYFGGTVDLVMERITDILSGVPWIVVMTLVIIMAEESTFGVLLLALCLTGWIGTAATTRTQFYRFRGREYVLASRTLGASDARLIAKHILPNAMGTIITGAVLMIPSVIFSEATLSYLGLGFGNLSSLGVILSNNQTELTTHSYLLVFPSIVIALVMISFNLFGNGLRDAVNPSLKGEDE